MVKPMDLTEELRQFAQWEMTSTVLNRAVELELGRIGLTIPQVMILYCLRTAREPMTPMKLSRMMQKQPHTISALVHRMETQGLVKTKRDMKRKNWVRVSLTEKGDEGLERWLATTTVPGAAFSSLSKKEKDMLCTVTKKLHAKSLELIRGMQPNPFSEGLFW